ncbi:MAG: hypothetical protein DRH30_14295 [Deltaproteobacteria bacterium]|nr:MAG: hypothetical protein DRH30_14295 [Deltaproteobacteria bacterium]
MEKTSFPTSAQTAKEATVANSDIAKLDKVRKHLRAAYDLLDEVKADSAEGVVQYFTSEALKNAYRMQNELKARS